MVPVPARHASQETDLGAIAEATAEDALTALVDLLGADLEACNRTIVARMDSPVALIPQLAAHIVAAGGKRLRPLLTLAAARLCGYPARRRRHVKLAACVEFIHTATLLHDDVVDESQLRRGLASRQRDLRQQGLGAGRRLPVRPRLRADGRGRLAARCWTSCRAPPRRSPRARCCNSRPRTTCDHRGPLSGGHPAARPPRCSPPPPRSARSSPARPPARAGGAAPHYGLNLGIAFQLVDDALDYAGRPGNLGKTVGDDFREGKVTLPVLAAYRPRRRRRARVLAAHDRGQPSRHDADLDRALHLMSGAARSRRRSTAPRGSPTAAKHALALFPDSAVRAARWRTSRTTR